MNIFERTAAKCPQHAMTPLWANVDEYRAWQAKEAKKAQEKIDRENRQQELDNMLGRSGIKRKHQNCSFDNYYTQSHEQRGVLRETQELLAKYQNRENIGFVFSGTPGTGKNHLACAIANKLLRLQRKVVVITVSELMASVRETYSPNATHSENEVIKYFAGLDLLIIDEVGRSHRGSDNQRVILDRLIDLRYQNENPTGLITNLQQQDLVETIGEAALERVLEHNGKWLTFNWPSYRR